jgi:hypothetical protein
MIYKNVVKHLAKSQFDFKIVVYPLKLHLQKKKKKKKKKKKLPFGNSDFLIFK